MKVIKVNDMHCMHCQQTIEKALKKNHIRGKVDLDNREVTVENSDVEKAISAIKEAGFTPAE